MTSRPAGAGSGARRVDTAVIRRRAGDKQFLQARDDKCLPRQPRLIDNGAWRHASDGLWGHFTLRGGGGGGGANL